MIGTVEIINLIVRFDLAGKIIILYMPILSEIFTSILTIGFNMEDISYNNIFLKSWDIGCQEKI